MKLLSSNVDYTIKELMDRLDISRRSVFRYLDTLRVAGFAVQKKKGTSIHKLLSKSDDSIDLSRLIHLSEEEAYLLHNLLGALSSDCQVMINLEEKLTALFNATSVTEIIGNKVNGAATKTATHDSRTGNTTFLSNSSKEIKLFARHLIIF